MKTTIKEFKKLVREEFKRMLAEGDVDSERRRNAGYDEVDSGQGVEYHDLPESLEIEDVDRLRRNADGYGDSEFDENLDEQEPDLHGDPGPFPPGRKLPKKIGGSPEAPDMPKVGGGVEPKAAALGQVAGRAATTSQTQAKTILHSIMNLPGADDPQVWKMIKTLAQKHAKGSPLATMSPGTQSAPSEGCSEDGEKKKRVGKGHAAERGHKAEVGFGEGFDAPSGRDPKETEPFDKALHVPIHNMSDAEDVPLVDIDVEIEEVKMPGLSQVTNKK